MSWTAFEPRAKEYDQWFDRHELVYQAEEDAPVRPGDVRREQSVREDRRLNQVHTY